MARVLPYPWSLAAPRGDQGASLSLEDSETAPALNPETLSFFTREADESPPRLAGQRQCAVRFAQGVMFHPHIEAGRRPGVLSLPALPHENAPEWRVCFGTHELTLQVRGGLRRASAGEEWLASNEREMALRDAVDVLCGYFAEAFALTHDRGHPELNQYKGQPVAQLPWSLIWKRWKKLSTGEEPRMARVVEIATSHLAAIRDVCERPRRMLVRQRELLPIGRVQELDAACLRDLIRAPGRTILEKAGPRQEIRGITRRETVDTAENRVMRDFLRLCQHRSRAYERENGNARSHSRVRLVVDLRNSCERLEAFSPLSAAGRLVGVPRPNYVLQKDRRYHPLWIQYDKLRREEQVVDNVWSWSRRLWAEFVRGVVVGFLAGGKGQAAGPWRQDGPLACYLRNEQAAGGFLTAASVSSRWLRQDGRARMLLVHPAHAHRCPGLEQVLPRLGAELAVVVYPGTGPLRPRGVLCLFSVMSLGTEGAQRAEMTGSLEATLEQVSNDNPGIQLKGLLLRGESAEGSALVTTRQGRLDYLAARAGGRFWFHEFPELLNILLEELAE